MTQINIIYCFFFAFSKVAQGDILMTKKVWGPKKFLITWSRDSLRHGFNTEIVLSQIVESGQGISDWSQNESNPFFNSTYDSFSEWRASSSWTRSTGTTEFIAEDSERFMRVSSVVGKSMVTQAESSFQSRRNEMAWLTDDASLLWPPCLPELPSRDEIVRRGALAKKNVEEGVPQTSVDFTLDFYSP